MLDICKECGVTTINGEHPKGFMMMDHNFYPIAAKIKCVNCGASVRLRDALQQGITNWRYVFINDAAYCPGCAHSIEN